MMSTLTPADSRHSKSMPALITKLLAERQQVLVLFNRLVQLKAATAIAAIQSLLQRFCQALVDYVALGHFEVYQALEAQADDSDRCRQLRYLAHECYPGIVTTTEAALAFNDRYDCQANCEIDDSFWVDLSCLGEELATRIELEDRLIAAIRTLATV